MSPHPDNTTRLARNAMGTRFEIVLHGGDPPHLRAAGEDALNEIGRIEGQLSIYRPETDISRINRTAHSSPVQVDPRLFSLLETVMELSRSTDGAFDITAGPLVRAWGFHGGDGRVPSMEELDAARERVGWQYIDLDTMHRTVRLMRPGMVLDMGSIGKGYAVDRAVQILREEGVQNGLIHGGTSTVWAWGSAPDGGEWKVQTTPPDEGQHSGNVGGHIEGAGRATIVTAQGLEKDASMANPVPDVIALQDESLSMSAVWGRSFQLDDQWLGHVVDPRSGIPVKGLRQAVVVLGSATESDALATALLVLGPEGISIVKQFRPMARLWWH
jgi:FAD:protein FMN transferase